MINMSAHPVAAFKRVTMTVNGVTKNVVVPVSDHTENDSPESDNDDCVILDSDSADSDLEAEDIVRCEDECESPVPVVDLTSSPKKSTDCPTHNIRSASYTANVARIMPRSPTAIVMPITVSNSTSPATVVGKVSSEVEQAPFPSSTIVRNVASKSCTHGAEQAQFPSSTVFRKAPRQSWRDNAEIDNCPQFSQSSTCSAQSSETSEVPVVIEPRLGTEEMRVSLMPARTLTKEEAVAAGWFADESNVNHFQSNVVPVTHPIEELYHTSMLSGTVPTMGGFCTEPVVANNFVPSAELVSIDNFHALNVDVSQNPVNVADCIPIASAFSSSHGLVADRHCSSVSSRNRLPVHIDLTLDGSQQPHVVENKLGTKFDELFDYFKGEGDFECDRLKSEEDEPLTAVIEGTYNDDSWRQRSHKNKPAKTTKEKTAVVKKRRPGRPPKSKQHPGRPPKSKRHPGRPPKSKSTRQKTPKGKAKNMAKRTGGRPLTASERYGLRKCGVWLQQLRLPANSINVRTLWRYLCCRESVPSDSKSCCLCRGKRMSDGFAELAVARNFRAGSRHCTQAARQDFAVDPVLLSALKTGSSRLSAKLPKKTTQNTSPLKTLQTLESSRGSTSEQDKKYLLIRTETGTFVVPVDSAVGCIVSEQEIASALTSQSATPPASSAIELSKDTLLAACSQLERPGSSGVASPGDSSSGVQGASASGNKSGSGHLFKRWRSPTVTASSRRYSHGKHKLLFRELRALGIKSTKWSRGKFKAAQR